MNEWLKRQAAEMEIAIEQVALERLSRYQQLLAFWNERINLTSITEPQAVYELHFLDSLSVHLVADMSKVCSLVDVGTGAGFPGLVLASVFPELRVTLLDSTEKKVEFLRLVSRELGLEERVSTVCLRAEQAGQTRGLREGFQVAVSRGVARLAVLAEYCMPLVSPAGVFVAMKGPGMADELTEAGTALQVLGGGVPQAVEWSLPNGAARTLLAVPKVRATPSGYPRRIGLPSKRPLH